VYTLHKIERYSYSEIAQLTKLSKKTIANHIYLATKFIQKKIAKRKELFTNRLSYNKVTTVKVENYKTNVKNQQQANYLIKVLQLHVSDCQLTFDQDTFLLSVSTRREVSELVCFVVSKQGFLCKKIT